MAEKKSKMAEKICKNGGVKILKHGHYANKPVLLRVANSGEISPKIGFLGKFYLTGDVGEILGKFDAKEEKIIFCAKSFTPEPKLPQTV